MPVDLPRIALVTLATARLSHLMTSDKLPEWLVIGRFRWNAGAAEAEKIKQVKRYVNAANALPNTTPRQIRNLRRLDYLANNGQPFSWQMKVVSGLDCPWCGPFWLGALVLVGEAVTRRAPAPARVAWTFALSALALNYVTARAETHFGS